MFRLTDLIVAAPFYYGKKEGGAVYVYTKLSKNPRDMEKYKPVKLVGREESRFVLGFFFAVASYINTYIARLYDFYSFDL